MLSLVLCLSVHTLVGGWLEMVIQGLAAQWSTGAWRGLKHVIGGKRS
jgi:hypothetical protein